MTDRDQPPVDHGYIHARLDRIEQLVRSPLLPAPLRRAVRDEVQRIRAELDPAQVRCEHCGRTGLPERVDAHDC